MAKKIQVPFDEDGNLLVYPQEWRIDKWVDNFEFEAIMEVATYTRGRSAARFVLKDTETGVIYETFMKEFLRIVQSKKIDKGIIEKSKWTFCKRGQNYGVMLRLMKL